MIESRNYEAKTESERKNFYEFMTRSGLSLKDVEWIAIVYSMRSTSGSDDPGYLYHVGDCTVLLREKNSLIIGEREKIASAKSRLEDLTNVKLEEIE